MNWKEIVLDEESCNKREEKIINCGWTKTVFKPIINKLEGIKIGKNLGGMSGLLWE